MAKRTKCGPKKSEASKPEYVGKYRGHLYKSPTSAELEMLADEMYEWFIQRDNYWLKDFGISRMVSAQRITEYAARSDYFARMLEVCKELQESKLVKRGWSKEYNSAMSIFALKNVAAWRDSTDQIQLPPGKRLIIEDTPA